MNIDELLRRSEELDKAATKGPWKSKLNHAPYKCVWISKSGDYSTLELKPEDADLIAFQRNHGPAIVRALSVAVKALEKISADSDCRGLALDTLARIAAELKPHTP
jgi:hypothetical protein